MGKRGPKPRPTAVKLLEGARPHEINYNEPVPGTGPVEPPQWLRELDQGAAGETALGVWNRLAPDLEAAGVMTPWDVDLFAVYCDAVVNHRRAATAVKTYGLLVEGQKGNLVRNPAVQLARDYANLAARVGARFGLSPSDRSGVEVLGPVDPAERFFS